ncbi:MAG: hypothetical protein V4731_08290 [Pseudomonadota bacterium]
MQPTYLQDSTSATSARLPLLAGLGLAALLCFGSAMAQTPGPTGIDASGSTRQEKAACNSGMTQQDYATCMREANNAAADKQGGKLDSNSSALRENALQRCEVLTGEDKIACQARVVGIGSSSGSVAGGGVVRQVETVVVPADAGTVTIQPQTSSDLVVIPAVK